MNPEPLGLYAVFYDGETRPVAGFVLEQDAERFARQHGGETTNYEIRHVHIANDWQPIETAPKDGTEILSLRWLKNFWWYAHVRWFNGSWTFCNDGDSGIARPTLWVPLPDPPNTQATACPEGTANNLVDTEESSLRHQTSK